jgi:hypothetical protein
MPTKRLTEKSQGGIDQRLVKAMSHPHRLHALKILNERTASPIQLAPIVGTTVGRIAYHVRELERLDCIELVETRPVRGATEHFYRATARAFFDAEDWAQLPLSVRNSLSGVMMTEIWASIGNAMTAGTFDSRDDRHVSWTPMVVDDDGWGELRDILARALDEVIEVQAKSAARIAKSGGSGTRVGAAMTCFELPPGEAAEGPPS